MVLVELKKVALFLEMKVSENTVQNYSLESILIFKILFLKKIMTIR